MKIGKIKLIFIFLCIFFPKINLADSPLTSTPFHDEYTDEDIVLKAEQLGFMNKEIADYLHDSSNPIDIKAAVINALGWSTGKKNAKLYSDLIYNREVTESDVMTIKDNDLFVIGYLKALDDYFNVSGALPFLKRARLKNKESFTVAIIEALVKAQKVMDKDFCKVWKYADKVFSKDDLIMDMRDDARKIIYDYMVLYKKDCK